MTKPEINEGANPNYAQFFADWVGDEPVNPYEDNPTQRRIQAMKHGIRAEVHAAAVARYEADRAAGIPRIRTVVL